MFFFFFKQKTAYEMRISDWSSDVCSSDLQPGDGFVSSNTLAELIEKDAPVCSLAWLIEHGAKPTARHLLRAVTRANLPAMRLLVECGCPRPAPSDRKSTRLNSSH